MLPAVGVVKHALDRWDRRGTTDEDTPETGKAPTTTAVVVLTWDSIAGMD